MEEISQAQDPEEQNAFQQMYRLLGGAIPSSAEELLGDGKAEEWTEEQLKNLDHFCRMLWNTHERSPLSSRAWERTHTCSPYVCD